MRKNIYITEEQKNKILAENKKNPRRVYITESQYRQLINEGMLLTEAKSVVDNFDLVGNLINLTDPDQFFFVQIVKRWKDNKDKQGAQQWRQNGRNANTYHHGGDFGNFASGTAFKVHSKQELDSLKPQIIAYCDANNARAYITCNPRSESAINSHLANLQKKFGANLNPWDKKYGFEHMAGQAKAYDPIKWSDRVRFFLDIDTKKNAWYIPSTKANKIHVKKVTDKNGKEVCYVDDVNFPKLKNCITVFEHSGSQIFLPKYPNQEAEIQAMGGLNVWGETKNILNKFNVPVETEYETPSGGLHVVIEDVSKIQDFKGFERALWVFDDGLPDGLTQLVHANMDGKLILYSNVDTAGY